MKCYIAGPMRGYPDLNFPAFNKAAEDMQDKMWEVVNPVDINPDPSYSVCMYNDIKALIECDAIYMLRGWEKSNGASLEYQIANALELEILYEV